MLIEYVKPTFLSIICLILCLSYSAVAQTSDTAARKFDEFGDALPTDMAARLDNYAIELQNKSSGIS